MARSIHKLTARKLASLRDPGRYSDGGGLYCVRTKAGHMKWSFVYTRNGKKTEMGLGAAGPVGVSLADARRKAEVARQYLQNGEDPLKELRRERAKDEQSHTFGDLADEYIEAHASSWKNEKHREQWRMSLTKYAAPLRSKDVSEITTEDVLKVVEPLWTRIPETAARVLGRIERVLNAAKAKGLRSGENPAQWKGHMENLLPKRNKLSRGSHPAMPFQHVADFMSILKANPNKAARALEFVILTAARTGEVLGATWSEIDLEARIWTIPAVRMKAGREHRVPLTERCMEIVEAMRPDDVVDPDGFVFEGARRGRPMSNMTLTMMLRRYCEKNPEQPRFTVHGFRSSFRDWVAEKTDHPGELAEMALAHIVGNATERAYRRGDILEKRRVLMEEWAMYLNC